MNPDPYNTLKSNNFYTIKNCVIKKTIENIMNFSKSQFRMINIGFIIKQYENNQNKLSLLRKRSYII